MRGGDGGPRAAEEPLTEQDRAAASQGGSVEAAVPKAAVEEHGSSPGTSQGGVTKPAAGSGAAAVKGKAADAAAGIELPPPSVDYSAQRQAESVGSVQAAAQMHEPIVDQYSQQLSVRHGPSNYHTMRPRCALLTERS